MWFCCYNSPHVSVVIDFVIWLLEWKKEAIKWPTPQVLSLEPLVFPEVILNSSNYVLPYLNDGETYCIGETFYKQINEGQAGCSDCLGKVITPYLHGCWKAVCRVTLQPPGPFGLILCQLLKRYFFEWHSGRHVEHVQWFISYFEWLGYRIHHTFLLTQFSTCNFMIHYWTIQKMRWNLSRLHCQQHYWCFEYMINM